MLEGDDVVTIANGEILYEMIVNMDMESQKKNKRIIKKKLVTIIFDWQLEIGHVHMFVCVRERESEIARNI